VLKYLARYLTGGPISDRRLISDGNGHVTFWARTGRTPGGDRTDRHPCSLPGPEFVRRWSLHILPRNFVKTRRFGGYSNRRRQRYLSTCQDLLPCHSAPVPGEPKLESPVLLTAGDSAESPEPNAEVSAPACPDCGGRMHCIADRSRESWSVVMHSRDRPHWYRDGS